MTVDFVKATLKKSRILSVSHTPRFGILTFETTQGPYKVQIDEDSAGDLLDEILTFLGVPHVLPQSTQP